MNDTEIRIRLLLSVQRALLGAVPSRLRGVTCGWEGTEVKLRYVFDGEIDPDDQESTSCASTEVIADFPDPWTLNEDFVRLDYPSDLRPCAHELWAYIRKEPDSG